jgi:hypothetical protein
MSLRSAHCETRALTARRASHQLWSYAGLIVERYSSLSATVDRCEVSVVGAILYARHYNLPSKDVANGEAWPNLRVENVFRGKDEPTERHPAPELARCGRTR